MYKVAISKEVQQLINRTIKSQIGADSILGHYRNVISRTQKIKRKLKNPINERTGEPLKPITIKGYESALRSSIQHGKNQKSAIQWLVNLGILPVPKEPDAFDEAMGIIRSAKNKTVRSVMPDFEIGEEPWFERRSDKNSNLIYLNDYLD